MTLVDYFGILLSVVLVGRIVCALADLLIKIVRSPKKEEPTDWTALSPYPFVPEMIKTEEDRVKYLRNR